MIDDDPFITSITRAAASATLIWTSISGRAYRVHYRTNITDPSWPDLNGDVFATTNTATKTDSTIGTAPEEILPGRLAALNAFGVLPVGLSQTTRQHSETFWGLNDDILKALSFVLVEMEVLGLTSHETEFEGGLGGPENGCANRADAQIWAINPASKCLIMSPK